MSANGKTIRLWGLATLVALAAPAAAQYYPQPQPNPRGGILGAIVDNYR